MKSFSDAVQGPRLTHHISRFIPDRVITTLILAFVGLAIVDQVQAYRSMVFTIKSMTGITPFFLLAIVFAGYAKASGVYSPQGTKTAIALLIMGGISCQIDQMIPFIQNKAGDNICPFEKLLKDVESPDEAYRILKDKLMK